MQRQPFLPPGPALTPPTHLCGRISRLTTLILGWCSEIEEDLSSLNTFQSFLHT